MISEATKTGNDFLIFLLKEFKTRNCVLEKNGSGLLVAMWPRKRCDELERGMRAFAQLRSLLFSTSVNLLRTLSLFLSAYSDVTGR